MASYGTCPVDEPVRSSVRGPASSARTWPGCRFASPLIPGIYSGYQSSLLSAPSLHSYSGRQTRMKVSPSCPRWVLKATTCIIVTLVTSNVHDSASLFDKGQVQVRSIRRSSASPRPPRNGAHFAFACPLPRQTQDPRCPYNSEIVHETQTTKHTGGHLVRPYLSDIDNTESDR